MQESPQHCPGEFVGGVLYNQLKKFITDYALELLEVISLI